MNSVYEFHSVSHFLLDVATLASVVDFFQALSKELENSHLELKKQTLRQEIDEGQAAAAAWHQHQMLLQQQYQQQQLQLQQQQLQLQQLQQQQHQLPPPHLPPPPQQPQQQQPQQQIDWKSIPVADDSLPKPWEAREDRHVIFLATVSHHWQLFSQ